MSATSQIKAALRRRYCAPEWAVMFEVGDATGARHTRFADAVAMSLWPSRGLTLHGFEIKISRSDWKKERAQPEKAETIAAYCDYWTLVTAKNVVSDPDEIPPAWGWLEWDGAKFNRRRDDTRTEAQATDRRFLAALLRRADKTMEDFVAMEAKKLADLRDETFELRVQAAVSERAQRNNQAAELIEEFEKSSGVKLEKWRGQHNPTEVGRALRALLAAGIDRNYRGMFSLSDDLRNASDQIEKAMSEHGFDRPEELRKGRR